MSEIEDQEHSRGTQYLMQELYNIKYISYIYLLVGSYYAFILNGIEITFYNKGLLPEQLSNLGLLTIPIWIRFVWALLMDSYFITTLGRRKTYITTSLMLVAIFGFVISFQLEDWVQSQNITNVVLVGALILFIVTILEISVDAWIADYIDAHLKCSAAALKYCSFVISFGITSQIIQQFNISCSIYLRIISLPTVILLAYFTATQADNNFLRNSNSCSVLRKNFRRLTKLYSRKPYSYLLVFLFIVSIGTNIIDNQFLITKSDQMTLNWCLYVVILTSSVLTVFISIKLTHYRVFSIAFSLRIFNGIFILAVYSLMPGNDIQMFLTIYQLVQTGLVSVIIVSIYSFLFKVDIQQISAIFLTCAFIMLKLGQHANIIFSKYLFDNFGLYTSFTIGTGIQIISIIYFENFYNQTEESDWEVE